MYVVTHTLVCGSTAGTWRAYRKTSVALELNHAGYWCNKGVYVRCVLSFAWCCAEMLITSSSVWYRPTLVILLIAMPATSAAAEKSFSRPTLRRFKTYLLSTMSHEANPCKQSDDSTRTPRIHRMLVKI